MSIDSLFPKMVELAKRMRWEAKEVVRDTTDGPQLYVRLVLTGPVFEHRAQEPFVVVGGTPARIVEIDGDQLSVRAYFDHELRSEQQVEFGYFGDGVVYRFPIRYMAQLTERLDRKLLPREVRPLRQMRSGVHEGHDSD